MTEAAPSTPPPAPTMRLAFDINPLVTFDMIAQTGDGGTALGHRMAAAVLAPPSFLDLVGMSVYGLTNVQRVALKEEPSSGDIAARLHPELFSDNEIEAHRAASPLYVKVARDNAIAAVDKVLQARRDLIGA